MPATCATWSMPMNASTSGISLGSSSRNRCGRQPETMTAWPRLAAARNSTDSKIVSTLSSCAESMKEQVLTMTASARVASLVISTPLLRSEPSMISASTRFLAQPREINPTRSGRSLEFFLVTGNSSYAKRRAGSKIICRRHWSRANWLTATKLRERWRWSKPFGAAHWFPPAFQAGCAARPARRTAALVWCRAIGSARCS